MIGAIALFATLCLIFGLMMYWGTRDDFARWAAIAIAAFTAPLLTIGFLVIAGFIGSVIETYTREPTFEHVRPPRVESPPYYRGERPTLVQRRPTLDETTNCVDRFPKLPALAERLDVEQAKPNQQAVVIEMCDGRAWDVFDILNALLDRLERR